MSEPRLLFVTRKFPPAVGGMERLSGDLARELGKLVEVEVVAGGAGRGLAALGGLAAGVGALARGRTTHVLLGDALLAPLGACLRPLASGRVVAVACGLDVTYPVRAYQAVVPRALARLDGVIAISADTRAACVARGVDPARVVVVPPGIDPARFAAPPDRAEARRWLEARVGPLEGPVFVTVGRLIPRKGQAWFAEHVMPLLPAGARYVAIGEGPCAPRILDGARRAGVEGRVHVLSGLDDADVDRAYAAADAAAMPNVLIPGDVEGFGIVAIEAAAAGLPVVAADLQGLRDAVLEGETGLHAPPGDAAAFAAAAVAALAFPGDRAREVALARFAWPALARRFLQAIAPEGSHGEALPRR